MKKPLRPLDSPEALGILWVVFAGFLVTLWTWYRYGLLLSDPHSVAMWIGTSFLAAFAAVELYRRVSVTSIALVLLALTLLVSDYARHSMLMLQGSYFFSFFYEYITVAGCIHQGNGFACWLLWLAQQELGIFVLWFAALAAVAARRISARA